MIRLQKAPSHFNYSDYMLSSVLPNGRNEPLTLPPPPMKQPIRMVSLVERSESSLLDLLYEVKNEFLNRKNERKKTKAENVCTECGKAYMTSSTFQNTTWIRHSLLHIAVDQYQCHLCDFKCRDNNEMKTHLCMEHQISERTVPPQTVRIDYTEDELDLIDEKARDCFPDWGRIAPSITDLSFLRKIAPDASKRKSNVTGTAESCMLCGEEVFANKHNMYNRKEEHAAEAHSGGSFHRWGCNKCSFVTNNVEAIGKHFKKGHPSETFNVDKNVKHAGHHERRKFATTVLECFPDSVLPRVLL